MFKRYIPNKCFIFVLSNKLTIGSIFSFKDVLPKELQSSLVYKYSCLRCTATYVGCTRRTLSSRAAEHSGRSIRANRLLSSPPHSKIRQHVEQCGYSVSFNNFKILGKCNKNFYSNDIRILESLYIFKLQPILNDAQSSFPLQIVKN